jgi:mannose-1-phosphate guanylyltransferase
VILYPSDHFIYPEMRFQAVVRAAIAAADALPQKVVLLGVAANRPELDYGWIQPGSELRKIEGHSVKTAIRFKEKPAFESGVQAASTAGGLWNTLVLAAQAELLWSLGQRRFPKLMEMLEQFAPNIGNEDEEEQLNILYRKLGNHDFSSELLEKLPHQIAVIELDGVVWSDWGRPERIRESLGQMGKSLSLSRAYAKIG